MEPSGIIFAALDCDADAIERWNRWYDLEHTPPNVALDGVALSRRYVAPPELHAARQAPEGSPFAGGRATFLTTYVLTGDPSVAFQGMTDLLQELHASGRMSFPSEQKAVREGDCFETVSTTADPALCLDPADVPFLGHTGVVVVQRRGDAGDRAEQIVALTGVHGVWTLESRNRPGLLLDLVLVEGDPAAVAAAIREEAPLPPGVEPLLDAPFTLIDPLRYPWAEAIRSSDLPATVA